VGDGGRLVGDGGRLVARVARGVPAGEGQVHRPTRDGRRRALAVVPPQRGQGLQLEQGVDHAAGAVHGDPGGGGRERVRDALLGDGLRVRLARRQPGAAAVRLAHVHGLRLGLRVHPGRIARATARRNLKKTNSQSAIKSVSHRRKTEFL